jgi:hypothetical protein
MAGVPYRLHYSVVSSGPERLMGTATGQWTGTTTPWGGLEIAFDTPQPYGPEALSDYFYLLPRQIRSLRRLDRINPAVEALRKPAALRMDPPEQAR